MEDITAGPAREIMILVLYLFQSLPQLIPRATIEFFGRLGDKQTKAVELTNPSAFTIAYTARLEGHQDFTIETTLIKLEPKTTVQFPVNCRSTTTNTQAWLLRSYWRPGFDADAS